MKKFIAALIFLLFLTPLFARETLTADRTYFVRVDGSDDNDGLSDSSQGAFLTLHKACIVATTLIDIGVYNVTIQLGNGTFDGSATIAPGLGLGRLRILGNQSSPTSVVVTCSTGTTIDVTGAWSAYPVRLSYFQVQSSAGIGIVAQSGVQVEIEGIDFGQCAESHMKGECAGQFNFISNYTISGGAKSHYDCRRSGFVNIGAVTVTISNTPNFSNAFAFSTGSGMVQSIGTTFTGSITGKRYSATLNGVVSSNGGGSTYFPGNAAGTTGSGGQYN